MQQGDQKRSAGRGGGIEIFASEVQREKAFRRARRHTLSVRVLKALLPATALLSVGVYGASLFASSQVKGPKVSVGNVSIDPTNLTMDAPRYSGFAKDGSEYRVRAKSAITDLAMSKPIRLDIIDGTFIQPTGAVTRLKAKWGTYDQKKDLLELYDEIDVDGTTGMKARLTRATVHTKQNRIESDQPVYAETDTGNIRANAMKLDSKARIANFRGAVDVTMRSNAPPPSLRGADAPPVPEPKPTSMPLGLQPNSREPIRVRSQSLDVDDTAKTALFRGEVVASQAEATLRAPELDVLYDGKATPMPGGGDKTAAGPAATPAGEQAKLKKIKARGGVVMTNRDDRAESQQLEYDASTEQVLLRGNVIMSQAPGREINADEAMLDQKADTALLTGDVVVKQERNVMRAGHLSIDRKAGTARLARPAVKGRSVGRISTVFYQPKPAGGTAAPQAASTTDQPFGALGGGFKSNPNEPIDVEAATLDIDERKHTAIYLGDVIAKQGAFVVRTAAMTAHYVGDTGLIATGEASAKAKAASGRPTGSKATAQLARIEARKGVNVTGTDGQQAEGEWANFDVKRNTVVMGGKVTVTQGKQVVRAPDGMRLRIDLTSGVTRFEAEPGRRDRPRTGPQVSGAFSTSVEQGKGVKNSTAACPPGAVCRSGRLEAILYPNQLKDKAAKAASGNTVDDVAAQLPWRAKPSRQ